LPAVPLIIVQRLAESLKQVHHALLKLRAQ
jgi:hypothetical protein